MLLCLLLSLLLLLLLLPCLGRQVRLLCTRRRFRDGEVLGACKSKRRQSDSLAITKKTGGLHHLPS